MRMLHSHFVFLFSCVTGVAIAAPPPDSHAAPKTHTSLIPAGIRAEPDKNPFPYVRGVETDKESCTGFDLGCGFVLTAGHCDAEGATITTGLKGEKTVGKAVRAYTAPGWTVPDTKAGWVSAGGDNNDIKLVKFDAVDRPGEVLKTAEKLIDWNMKPFVVEPKRPADGWIAGYGATNAIWDEKKGTWIPFGPAGELAWGKVSLDYSGYYTAADSGNLADGFGPHRNGRGRICSEPRPGFHGVINGDSGGPLVGPDGMLRGVIASFARGRSPDETTKIKYDYVSCFVDLAGHLPWIYETMKADGCKTLPVVAALDKLKSPPGVLMKRKDTPTILPPPAAVASPEPTRPPSPPGPGPGFLLPPVAIAPQRARESDDERAVRRILGHFTYEKMQQKREESLRAAETLRDMAKRYRDRRKEYETEARTYEDLAKAYGEVYPTLERGKVNRTYVAMSTLHQGDRDDLRAAIGAIVNVAPGQRVSFGNWAKYEGDTISVSYGFCPTNRDLKDCKFEEKGVVTVTKDEVRASIRHTVR